MIIPYCSYLIARKFQKAENISSNALRKEYWEGDVIGARHPNAKPV
jgi:hypothetical protein